MFFKSNTYFVKKKTKRKEKQSLKRKEREAIRRRRRGGWQQPRRSEGTKAIQTQPVRGAGPGEGSVPPGAATTHRPRSLRPVPASVTPGPRAEQLPRGWVSAALCSGCRTARAGVARAPPAPGTGTDLSSAPCSPAATTLAG